MRDSVTREDVVEALGENKTRALERTAQAANRWSFLDDKCKLWTVVAVPIVGGFNFKYIKH